MNAGKTHRNSAGNGIESLEARHLYSAAAVTHGPVEGIPYAYKVGFNSHEIPYTAQPGDYEVEIHWGDGAVSRTRQITRIASYDSFYATDTHLYKDAGSLRADDRVIVHNLKTGNTWNQTQIQSRIDNAPLHLTVPDLNITGNSNRSYSGLVATFTSECTFDTADELTAYIYTSGGRFIGKISGGGGSFSVSADIKFSHAGDSPLKVVIVDSDGGNAGADAHAFVSDPAVARQTQSKLFKLNAEVEAYPTVTEFANEFNWTPVQTRAAIQDAVDAFANGIANPKAKPNQVAAAGSEKFPWSRSFFDAGRMLRGIATGTDNLVKLGTYITKNPQIFSPGNLLKLATQATTGVANAVKNPDKLLGAVYEGFNAFRTVDAADIAGQAIPAGVAVDVLGAAAAVGLGKTLPAAAPQKYGTIAAYVDAAGETFAASPSTWVTVFGRGTSDVTWILNVMKGLNVDTKLSNCVDISMMLDLKLRSGLNFTTRVLDHGKRSLEIIENYYGRTFSVATRDAFENGFQGVNREVRGIMALPVKGGLDEGHVINFVYKPGEGMWYLDGQLSAAFTQNSAETTKMFSAYSPKIKYMITN